MGVWVVLVFYTLKITGGVRGGGGSSSRLSTYPYNQGRGMVVFVTRPKYHNQGGEQGWDGVCIIDVLFYRTTQPFLFFFLTCSAALVAVSNTALTPSLVLAEHSR